MTPTGPCFENSPDGSFSFNPGVSSSEIASTTAILGRFFEKRTLFDRDGNLWRVARVIAPFEKSWWRVLVSQVYSPSVPVTLEWQPPSSYPFEELKHAYAKAVDLDDDILTQFVEADELKQKIAEAQNFDDLVAVYDWMQTEQPYEDEAES